MIFIIINYSNEILLSDPKILTYEIFKMYFVFFNDCK